MKIAKILAPVDFSVCSAVAVAYAAELSRLLNARVLAVHVISPYQASSMERIDGGASGTDRAMRELERFVISCREDGYAISYKIRIGRPVAEIVAEAEAGAFDLIVMGTRERSNAARFLRRSTTDAVLRRSHCPVVAVRNTVVPEVATLAELMSVRA